MTFRPRPLEGIGRQARFSRRIRGRLALPFPSIPSYRRSAGFPATAVPFRSFAPHPPSPKSLSNAPLTRSEALLDEGRPDVAASRPPFGIQFPRQGRQSMKRHIQCEACQDAGYVIDRSTDFCVAKSCQCRANCPHCGGTGFIRVNEGGYDAMKECDCRIRGKRLALFNAARIPARCDATFDGFQPSSDAMSRARLTAEATAREYTKGNPSKGFLISGPVGTGKTHLLCAALHWLTLESGVTARYVEISFLYSEIKNGFSHGQSVLEALEPLIAPDVLAIDEIGRGRCTEFEMEVVDELVARRYNTRKTTIFATNYRLKKDAAQPGGYSDPVQAAASQWLVDRIGERSWSRIREMCHCIELPPDTPDYRKARSSIV